MSQLPGEPMRPLILVSHPEAAIPLRGSAACPLPALTEVRRMWLHWAILTDS